VSQATILDKIVQSKYADIEGRKAKIRSDEMIEAIALMAKPRGFHKAIIDKLSRGEAAVIAEIKKASPSKGVIRSDFYPSELASSYQRGGAACLSVLTDVEFFQGADSYLKEAAIASTLPILRKDFVVDEYQITEARWLGADCVLLIAACLTSEQLERLYHHALSLDLDVLIEVHNAKELASVTHLKPKLIGINNRNLHTFKTSLSTTFDLLDQVPEGATVVTESGIHTTDDVAAMRGHNVDVFLVGESLMRADDPGRKLVELFN